MHRFTIVSRVACSSLMGYLVHRYIVSISVRQRTKPRRDWYNSIPSKMPQIRRFWAVFLFSALWRR